VAEEQLAAEKAQAEAAELRAQLATATKDAEKGRLEALHLLELTQRRLSASQDEVTRLRKDVDAPAVRTLPPGQQQASEALALPRSPVVQALLLPEQADKATLPRLADSAILNTLQPAGLIMLHENDERPKRTIWRPRGKKADPTELGSRGRRASRAPLPRPRRRRGGSSPTATRSATPTPGPALAPPAVGRQQLRPHPAPLPASPGPRAVAPR
jgi:hypothetical protein